MENYKNIYYCKDYLKLKEHEYVQIALTHCLYLVGETILELRCISKNQLCKYYFIVFQACLLLIEPH